MAEAMGRGPRSRSRSPSRRLRRRLLASASRCELRKRPKSARTVSRLSATVALVQIVVGREEDGRWWADIESMPGVMAYGTTRESAIVAVRALALRVAADCIDHGEEVPEPFMKVFSVA